MFTSDNILMYVTMQAVSNLYLRCTGKRLKINQAITTSGLARSNSHIVSIYGTYIKAPTLREQEEEKNVSKAKTKENTKRMKKCSESGNMSAYSRYALAGTGIGYGSYGDHKRLCKG